MRLAGASIWLIGASAGIGAALARALVEAGARVVVSARRHDALQTLAAELGPACTPVVCDVTDPVAVVGAASQASQALGGLDMVIYNAGVYDPTSSAAFDLEAVEQMLDVNLRGAVRVVHTVLPEMQQRRRGRLVLVGSVAGYRGLPRAMGYGMSKAALIHFAENLRQDLDGSGVEVQIVNPGFVKTRLTDKNDFAMPLRISPERAAVHMVRGLQDGRFEIHFPNGFTLPMKLLGLLPARAYFALSRWLLKG